MSKQIVHGFRRGSFFDPTTADVVQTNHLQAGGCSFVQEALDTGEADPTGGAYFGGDRSVLEWTFFDPDGTLYEQLRQWYEDETRISFVAEGLSRNVQWYERDRIDQCRRVDIQGSISEGRADGVYVRIVRTGHGSHDIHSNVNIVSHIGWADEDGDGVADGYSSDGDSLNFTNGVQALTESGSGLTVDGAISRRIPFPIAGATLLGSAEMIQLHGDGDNFIFLQVRDFSINSLLDASRLYNESGRRSVEAMTPPNTFYLDLVPLRLQQVDAQGTAKIKDPALRTDDSDEYIVR